MSDPAPDAGAHRKRSALGADLIVPVLAAAFTIYFLVSSSNLVWEARANGTVIGVTLLALVAVQLVRIAKRARAAGGALGLGELAQWSPAQRQRLELFAILVLFVATIPWLGTTLGLFLVMLGAMWSLGVREWRTLIAVPVAVAGTVYVLFIALLQSRLPLGPVERLLASLWGGE